MEFCVDSRGPEETRGLAAQLGEVWSAQPEGANRVLFIALLGELGSGKTVFVKGLADGLGLGGAGVSSPTFVLANQYGPSQAGRSLHHVDFYRLESPAELETMGFFDLSVPGTLLAVEWADRFPEALPEDRIVMMIRLDSDRSAKRRLFEATATGPHAERVLLDWREALEALGRCLSPIAEANGQEEPRSL